MIIRQGLNFAVSFAGGVLVGALVVAACAALRRTADPEPLAPYEPDPVRPLDATVPGPTTSGPTTSGPTTSDDGQAPVAPEPAG